MRRPGSSDTGGALVNLLQLVQQVRINRLRKKGLQLGEGCVLSGMPFFGTEPFLISIGNRVSISGKVAFITHDGATWVFRRQARYEKVRKFGRIIVHDNCFIGYGALILPGVTIGPNSVVAAHALVTKDVPPDSVVGGNPARVLMSVTEFAEKCLANNADFNEELYRSDKKAELLRLYPFPW